MYVSVNVNPIKKMTGDCVIRAMALLTDMTWEQAYMELCKEGLLQADLPNANSVWGAFLKKRGFKRESIPNTCPDCYTVEDFAYDHPTGRYAVCTGTHVVAIMDGGNYFDAWDSGSEIPSFYYYKED